MKIAELKKMQRMAEGAPYNEKNKAEFKRLALKTLRELDAMITQGNDSDIRYNAGGIAVSGEATLHGDKIYVQISNTDLGVLYRTCEGRKDYAGGLNRWYGWENLIANGVQGLANTINPLLKMEYFSKSLTAEDASNVAAQLAHIESQPEGPDFQIQNEGSLVILYPQSDAGRNWIAEHIGEHQEWCGGVVIESRYVGDVLAGIESDGLEVL
jgi:hypothetical protein